MIRPDVLRAARNVLRAVPGLLPNERNVVSETGMAVAGVGVVILSGAGDVDMAGDDPDCVGWEVNIS